MKVKVVYPVKLIKWNKTPGSDTIYEEPVQLRVEKRLEIILFILNKYEMRGKILLPSLHFQKTPKEGT